jgi:polysaccharide biosynthesis protein
MLLSYRLGQKYYPIRYPLKDIAIYTLVALVLFALITLSNAQLPMIAALAVNTLFILCFAFVIIKRDLPLSSLVKLKDKFKK